MSKKESNPPPPLPLTYGVVKYTFEQDLLEEILDDLGKIIFFQTEWKTDKVEMADQVIEQVRKIAKGIRRKILNEMGEYGE